MSDIYAWDFDNPVSDVYVRLKTTGAELRALRTRESSAIKAQLAQLSLGTCRRMKKIQRN